MIPKLYIRRECVVAIAAIAILALPTVLRAQVPRALSYQGVLTDSAGRPKPDGSYSFAFRLYPSASGGTALWTEIKTLLVSRGLFSTVLGDQVPVNLSFDAQYWLSIQVAADPELSPRIPLTSVGYSIHSLKADTAQYAMTAPQQTYVDSARIAGSIPNNIVTTTTMVDGAVSTAKLADNAVTSPKIADGAVTNTKIPSGHVVKSLNGVRDAITFRAQGGATITSSGDTITINAGTGGGGVGVQSVQNTNNTLDVLNPTGPTVTVNVKSQGIGTTQLVDGSVTQAKIGTDAVTSAKILDGTITGSDISTSAALNVASLTTTGNVGVGTSTPASKLHIKGVANAPQLIIDANSTQSNINPLIRLRSSGGTDLLWINSDNANNTFIGFNAGRVNNATGGGTSNTFIGSSAGFSNTTGGSNTANGVSALQSNTTGLVNTANGVNALRANTTGGLNTANGVNALFSNTESYNTAHGVDALRLTTASQYNVAVGYNAGN
jgi:hypothetical protein